MKPTRWIPALTALLLCLCLAGGALADAMDEKSYYETALQYLRKQNAEDVERAIVYFESAGNYGQAKLFTLYADALLKILTAEDDMSALDSAALRLKRVDREDFAQELAEQRLPSVEELRAYMNARRLEAEGHYEEAIAMYDTVGILDAFERSVELEEGYIDRQYRDAMALYEQGDYLKAAEIFQDLDWKDSAAMYRKCMEKHEHVWAEATCEKPRTCTLCGETDGGALGHDWKEATCTKARTCTRCGKKDGSALGHSWKDATCTEPRTCKRCGVTEGVELGHSWIAATSTKPQTCSRCGETRGEPLAHSHSWKAATCTEPRTCTSCGATEGTALGHNWKDATCTEPKTCTRCGKTVGKALEHQWQDATYTSPMICIRCGMTVGTKLALDLREGGIIRFGRYEQDNNTGNGPEEIEWYVLDCDLNNHRALLLSKYGLDAKAFNDSSGGNSWGYCSLRVWLNGEFLNTAFSAEEQTALITTEVDNGKEQGYGGWNPESANSTTDKVFLLSCAEARVYLGVYYFNTNVYSYNTAAYAAPTAYARMKGAYTSERYSTAEGLGTGWWWLRSRGSSKDYAANVSSTGDLNENSVYLSKGCVRPAIWIDLTYFGY